MCRSVHSFIIRGPSLTPRYHTAVIFMGFDWVPMIPRDASLLDSCAPYHQNLLVHTLFLFLFLMHSCVKLNAICIRFQSFISFPSQKRYFCFSSKITYKIVKMVVWRSIWLDIQMHFGKFVIFRNLFCNHLSFLEIYLEICNLIDHQVITIVAISWYIIISIYRSKIYVIHCI